MKKFLRAISLIMVFAMILAMFTACGSSGSKTDDSSKTDSSKTDSSTDTPADSSQTEATDNETATDENATLKDTLIWAQSADVFSFDPNIGKETVAIQVTGNIYDTLFTIDTEGNIIPMLATEWTQDDEVTYTIKLREGVTFHDGSPFTAEDAAYSIMRAVESPAVNYIAKFVDHVDIVDDHTIKLVTVEPYAPAIRNLTHPGMGITCKAYAEANGEDILKTAPMGTGPFKFIEWKQGDSVTLERFDDYWAGPAPMKTLIMRVIPEAAQRTIALETGEVDIAYDISPNDVSRLNETDGVSVVTKASLMCYYIGMNFQNEYLGNQKVREAIRLAIDVEPMIDAILYGGAQLATTVLAPACFGFVEDAPVIQADVEKAKALMAEAGYADGFDLTITVNEEQTRVEMCNVIQSQLKEIGINLKIDVVEQSTYVDIVGRGDHELCFQNWTTSTADADYTYYPLYHSTCWGSQGGRAFGEIPGIDAIVEQAKGETDPDKRIELYAQAEALVQEYSVNRPLVWTDLAVGLRDTVEGFELMSNTYHKLYNVKAYQ